MAYDHQLAERIRKRFSTLSHVEEKEMMGGITFMYNGKMCVGVIKDELMCRVDKTMHNKLVEQPGCRTMDFTNRPMIGYILVDQSAIKSDRQFNYWIQLALDFNKLAKSSKKKK